MTPTGSTIRTATTAEAFALALVLVLAPAPRFAGAAPAGALREESTSFQNVVVRPGDTLWSISHAYLKDPAKWDELLKYNRLPTSDPTVALPGMTLRVPVRLIKVSLRAAHVVFLVNQVLTRRRDRADWRNARESMEVFQGDSLRTLEDSKARVRFLNKDILSLDQNSMAVIKPSAEPDADVELKAGSVFAGRARVVTATARVTPKTGDTRYSASVDANLATKVEVFSGAAAVAAQGREIVVPAGMQTRVFPGLSPEPPERLDMPAELEARAQEYASAAANGGGVAADPRVPPPQPEPEADAESLRGDIRVLRIGQPIQGYHVTVARDRDFREVLFRKRYEVDEKFSAAATGLAPGTYWWRVAPIDLLGVEGRPRDARYYSLGLKPPDPENERLANMLQLSSPEENAEVGDTVKVAGVLLDERLTIDVNGKTIKPDEDGNFSLLLKTQFGGNAVHITISDGKGNETHLSRHVTRL